MRIAASSSRPVVTGLVILGLLASPSWQRVTIELRNGSGSLGDEYKYEYEDDRSHAVYFANIPSADNNTVHGELKGGYIWMWNYFPMDGCQYIYPRPHASPYDVNNGFRYRWFALIEGPSVRCPDDMVQNVRKAGFELVIGYNNGSSFPSDLWQSLRDSGFPMVSITSDYAEKLWEVATTNPNGSVTVDVYVDWKRDNSKFSSHLPASLWALCLLLLPLCCSILCLRCCRCRRASRYHTIPRRQQSRISAITLVFAPVAELPNTHRDVALPDLGELDVPVDMDELDVLAMRGFQMDLLYNEHEPTERPRPLENEEVNFPQKSYAHVRPDEFTIDESCRICLEEYEETEMVSILPCKHYFHPKCIEKWVTEIWGTCPICNQAVIGQM